MQLFFLPLTVAAAIISSTNALSSSSTTSSSRSIIKMVEGHSVHRIASRFRSQLVGKRFTASSPNGRFIDGARAIDGKYLSRMEAVGKNLFAFFSNGGDDSNEEDATVVHVHFGMSGAWAVFNTTSSSSEDEEPEVKPTTRLRLEEITTSSRHKICTHLSAMTVAHGNYSLYTSKKSTLGEDPLRSDASPDRLYNKVVKSKKSIGQLIMDQSYFAGPGNIYRAEILFLAGVYPTTLGINLDKVTFDRIWNVTVQLLRRGYDTGSILTVDAKLDPEVAAKGERRYIYNQSRCARCGGKVSSWDMSGRTCYACDGGCQPKQQLINSEKKGGEVVPKVGSDGCAPKSSAKKKKKAHKQHVPFISHCAPVDINQRLKDHGPEQLTIAEIRSIMEHMVDSNTSLLPKSANKSSHVQALRTLLMEMSTGAAAASHLPPPTVSAEDAAREKAISGEKRSVEHVAELSREQALGAISVTPSPAKLMRKKGGGKRRSNDDGGEVKKERRSTRRRLLDDE